MKEKNIIGNLKNKAEVKVAIGFPNNYYIGMSSLGWQVLYKELNRRTDVLCDRFFLEDDKKIKTLDSRRYLSEFNIIGFSVYYELDYINIIKILKNSSIPVYSRDRYQGYPLIIAGGPAVTLNPEPISDFIDIFVIGEGEEVIHEIIDIYKRIGVSQQSRKFKEEYFRHIVSLRGVYIPSIKNKVKRRIVSDINLVDTSSAIISSNTDFKNMYLIEIARGCGRGCRFCAAGYIYRKPRLRNLSSISSLLDEASKLTDKIGLVGSSVTDYPWISDLCKMLSRNRFRVSTSSLRIDKLNDGFFDMLVGGGQRTLTIAPEAASKRLKRFIGKDLDNGLLLKIVEKAVLKGISNIKLYFMIGLPTEVKSDIEDIVYLVKEIRKVFLSLAKVKGRTGELILSISPFIPKPFTPFQWEGINKQEDIEEKFLYIKNQLWKEGGIIIKSENTGSFLLQAAISRGDKNMAEILLGIADGRIKQKAREFFSGDTITRWYENDVLPWDFIDSGISREYLLEERKRAYEGKPQHTCKIDEEGCKICGVCNGIV